MNKEIQKIYDHPYEVYVVEDTKTVYVQMQEKGKILTEAGAYLHPDDEDFFSPKVGEHIALMRAWMFYFENNYYKYKREYKLCKQYYDSVINIQDKDKIDPTGKFLRKLQKMEKRYKDFKNERDKVKKELKKFLQESDSFNRKVEKIRGQK